MSVDSVSESKPRFFIPSLNGLRAVSIFVVFVGHAKALGLTVGGGFGVTIFFFISGFLITTLLRREYDRYERISLGDFYFRRFLKIVPPMVLTILLGMLLIQVQIIDLPFSWRDLLSMAVFLTNYARAAGFADIPEPLFVLWSLSVEEHFYIVFPLVYIALRKFVPSRFAQAGILLIVCLAVLSWRSYLHFSGVAWQPLNTRTDTRADALLWGCILAICFNPMMDAPRGSDFLWRWFAAPVGLVLIVLANLGTHFESHVGYTIQSLGICLFVIPAVRFPKFWMFAPLNWSVVDWFGKISYSFYLLHYLVIWTFVSLIDMNGFLSTLLSFAVTTLVAWIMYYFVEQPFARLRRRRSRVGESSSRPAGLNEFRDGELSID